MAMRLVRKRAVERDLADQVEYIAQDRPAAARRYLLAVEHAFDQLVRTPEIGEERRFRNPKLEGVRMWPVPDFPKYLIFYRATKTRIEVLRILHGARDIRSILGAGDYRN